ncbi:hypothetical protein GOEFS_109_00100 [Gordonia effusa NBRC 100432]|uniref:CRISPR-associated protein n=1 Tax=Gordonia effusa NBRC 100432 TaxID=1077974 RepID=H0R5B4_9ACTN|nr:hypothetical protein [Gordonia effusa]GAB20265.1 hypothetical protein GOEFS_109_00100 [Gordonia effusa NBRC 100432]
MNRQVVVQVRAELPHGMSSGRPWGPSLDGILAAVIWRRCKAEAALRGEVLTYDPAAGSPPDMDLPLARCTLSSVWHWQCTFGRLDSPAGLDPRIRTRRTDHAALQRLSAEIPKGVHDSRGHYRKRVVPALASVSTAATWWAVGDPDRLRLLLGEVPAIGKHRNSGEGRVSEWTVREMPGLDEWCAGHMHEPRLLGRSAAPECVKDQLADLRHGGRARFGVRAPYAHPSRHVDAYLPGE